MSNAYIPNSASIPNILFDYWMAKLTPGEFKVLMAIARKTYGWHKIRDMISLRQIEELTGLARKSISQMIESLVEHNLIIKIKSKTEWGDDAPNLYEINIYYDDKGGIIIDGEGSNLTSLRVDTLGNYQVGTSGNPQNPIYTKPNNTKKEREGCNPSLPPSPFSKKGQVSDNLRLVGSNEQIPLKEESIQRALHVFTTNSEHSKLISQHGELLTQEAYQLLSEWKNDTPKSKWKKNDYRSILRWVFKALKEKKLKEEELCLRSERMNEKNGKKNWKNSSNKRYENYSGQDMKPPAFRKSESPLLEKIRNSSEHG